MSESKTIYRLDEDQLDAVRQAAGLTYSVNPNSTPLEVAFQLGAGRVIEILRKGFTVTNRAPSERG